MNCIMSYRRVHGCSILVRRTVSGFALIEQQEVIVRKVRTLYGVMADLQLIDLHIATCGDKAEAMEAARLLANG